MSQINRAMAANLWENLDVSVDRFHAKITPHEKSVFLGYADITIDGERVLPGLKLKLRGVEVKELKGNPHIEMPSERAADGKFYPRYFPLSGELRQVLTMKIFSHGDVRSAVEAAKRATTQATRAGAESASSDNPFA